ncbi:hypothetical protein OPV22_003150 [Ensete ventricosum]|uniref:FERM central domain-containing protein n=1 Tax=Ensete ventricosum TaxID=4639 RepID=A0AAV8RZY4_ENSVE|nr:hypothetical protein OPV22_003150 [Ensete ventricosum]
METHISTKSLFVCRKVVNGSKCADSGNEEYLALDDNKYVSDLLAEFKAAKDPSKGEISHCKLISNNRLFRESDEAVADPMFVQLSYVQLQHDYMLGNYPVGRDDAAQISALQILVEIGSIEHLGSLNSFHFLKGFRLDKLLLHVQREIGSLILFPAISVRPTVENKVLYLVDVRDVADALLLVYEEPNASGRHICAPHLVKMQDLVDMLKNLYPHHKYPEILTEEEEEEEEDCEMHSVKLNNLGWKCRTLQETLIDTIEYHRAAGLLDRV